MIKSKQLAVCAETKNNNFDFIRLMAAIAVIFSHSYPLTGKTYEPLAVFSHGLTTFGGLAVSCFFIISGFLITRSYCQRHDLLVYLRARVLRIFPALIIAVLFAALIVGPIVTSLSLKAYFTNHETYTYIFYNSILYPIYALPGVFLHNSYPTAVNGSLWTLPIEFSMYLMVAFLGITRLLKKSLLASILLTTLFFIFTLHYLPTVVSADPKLRALLYPAIIPEGCFILGAIAYLCRKVITLNLFTAIALVISCFIFSHTFLYSTMFYITLTYGILLLTYQQKIHFNRLTRYGDFSYGVYIYAFPVQQTLMHFFHLSNPFMLFLCALPITLLLAMTSWFWIEKKALALKKVRQ